MLLPLCTPRRRHLAGTVISAIVLPQDFFRGSLGFAALAVAVIAAAVCGGTIAGTADAARAADTVLPEPVSAAVETAAPAFKPEDISIGEPISLPFATPLASPPPVRPPLPAAAPDGGSFPTPAAQLPSVIAPATPPAAFQPRIATDQTPADAAASFEPAAAGSGWLGLAVDDTVVTGRLVVVEVAPDGPAAKAGVRPRDMLLAINGHQLQNGDELAAALAAIAPGQRVKMAVGRDNRVEDVVAEASARPQAALSRDWQSATAGQNTLPNASVAISPAPGSGLVAPNRLAPNRLAPEATAIGVLPAPAAPSMLAPSMLPPATSPTAMLPDGGAADAGQPPRPLGASPTPGGRTALGVRTVPVDPTLQSRFRLSEARGAFVIGVVHDLPASRAGVPPGSVIVAINHRPVRSPQDLTQIVASGPVGTPVPLQYVLPGGESKQAEVVLQSLEQPLERALVGGGETGQLADPTPLQPTPLTTRRVQPAAVYRVTDTEPLVRMDELLRRMSDRLEQIERRLERLEPGR